MQSCIAAADWRAALPLERDLKICIFGLTLSSSWGNGHATPYRALVRALHRMHVEVVFYERDAPYYAKQRDFDWCDYCTLVLYKDWHSVRSAALQEARHSDIVLTASYVPDGARITEDLLELDGPLRVFYDLDTPITLRRLEQGGVDYLRREFIPGFDLYLSFTGGKILQRLEQEFGARLARPLFGCVDPDVYHRQAARDPYRCELSYMGTYAADRQPKLEELFLVPAAKFPDQTFLLAGSLYPWEWSWPTSVRRIEHAPPSEHPALYSSSRATLNLTRGEMAEAGFCPSGRFFEATACATPLLTDEWQGLDSFFNLQEELFVVHTREDVMRALALPDPELNRKALRARQRTLDEHTGTRRAQELLAHCEEALRFRPSTMEAFS